MERYRTIAHPEAFAMLPCCWMCLVLSVEPASCAAGEVEGRADGAGGGLATYGTVVSDSYIRDPDAFGVEHR